MASFQGRADVLSISSSPGTASSRPAAQVVPSSPHTLNAQYTTPDAPDGGIERGEKRRKLDNDNAVAVSQTPTDEDDSIVLAKVSLHLKFPTMLRVDMESFCASTASDAPLTTSLESFSRQGLDTFQTVLWHEPTATRLIIAATLPERLLDSMTPHLRTAATLTISHNGKKTRIVPRAAFNRCALALPSDETDVYTLDVEIRWMLGLSVVEDPSVTASMMKQDLKLLFHYFRDATVQTDAKWALSDFYDAVHVPPPDTYVSPRIQQSLTETALYPFQQRAVEWLLRREGVAFSPSGTLGPFAESSQPASFAQTQDASGQQCYVSQLRGLVVTKLARAKDDNLQTLRGGILAEEMGLGKTVELIALMTQHKRAIPTGNVYDAYTGSFVQPSGATLIITPPAILEQWISEIHTHAPELKVLHYKGLPPPSAPKKDHASSTVEYLMRYDVVLTTYHVLSREIYHATPPPDRSFRHSKRRERRSSPLVGISWWRVCLDEAQMIESGVSQAAKVARILPRCNAWAVSGTPLRKDVQDLRGLLIFLRCDAFVNRTVWNRLDKASFKAIFNHIALRHSKDKIRNELRLPPQKRIVITVPFTAIEEQHYTELSRQMCDACWLTPDGSPLQESRDISHPEVVERMREWLVRLRQTCLHAHVGRKNRRALGAKNGALRTVHEVLEVMIEQNDTSWKSEAREMILNQIKLGHITAYAGNNDQRAQTALPFYEVALYESQTYVAMCREELAAERQNLGKTVGVSDVLSATEQIGSEEENDAVEPELSGRIPIIRKLLRSFLELEHACHFFIATMYHQLKENEQLTKPESEDFHRLDKLETEWYEKAKKIRRELLKESKSRAQQQIIKVSSKKPFQQLLAIDDLPGLGGIEARKFFDNMDNISDFLNEQATLIGNWRMKIVDILLTRLVDDDDNEDTTGEEYDESLKAQDELYVYIMALRTLVADRNAAVNGLQDTLVEHEMKAAEKRATQKDEGRRGHAPELVIEVADTRRKVLQTLEGGSLKGVVSGVRSLMTGLQWKADNGDSRASAELNIVQNHFTRIHSIATQQAKAITELEKEQEMFRGTMNQRLEYYRQFQHISDSVAKWKEELDDALDEREFGKYSALRKRKQDAVSALKTKSKYLAHLRSENQSEEEAECKICLDVFEIGVLTVCGHKYCKVCINTWWHQHRTCPLCKNRLSSSDFKDISFKPSEMKAQEETHEPASPTQASTPGSSTTSIYSDISDSTMKEIKMIDLDGSYGTKIDMIARHLIWIRNNDPGAKTIIFSQFNDFLEVLREALQKWKIGVSGIVDKDGIEKFKSDAGVEAFLLDAKSDSSGLNLVNATYVFLCEPLINPAIELQAIARVHRIGQQRPTTVFMYLVSDTVEEAIYDISVTRRLEHISRSKPSSASGSAIPALQENTLEVANSAELQAAPLKQLLRKKGDGEIVQVDDLWNCLFGKQRKQAKPVLEREVDRFLRAEAAEERREEVEQVGLPDRVI